MKVCSCGMRRAGCEHQSDIDTRVDVNDRRTYEVPKEQPLLVRICDNTCNHMLAGRSEEDISTL